MKLYSPFLVLAIILVLVIGSMPVEKHTEEVVEKTNTKEEQFMFDYGDIPAYILEATSHCAFSIDSRTMGECIDDNIKSHLAK